MRLNSVWLIILTKKMKENKNIIINNWYNVLPIFLASIIGV